MNQYKEVLITDMELYRLIRKTETDMELQTDSRLYLYVMVPALTGFVRWVLEEAQKSGKKRLYFLSRDGYQMYLTAKAYTEQFGYDIQCRYLNVSRFSMRIPGYHLNPDKAIDQICVYGIDVTLEKILKRAALSAEEAADIITRLGWQDRCQDILNYRQILELKAELKKQQKLYDYIETHSKEAYDNAVGYLEQEGMLQDSSSAVVDSGWIGTHQQSIETLLKSKKPDISLEGYYFGMYETPRGSDAGSYHAYYFSGKSGLKRKVSFSNSLFETIISADEGMTVRYEKKGEKYVPNKDRTHNPNQEQMAGNIGVLEYFLRQKMEGTYSAEQRLKLTERLLRMFMAEPTAVEVEAYGDNLFSDDVLEGSLKKVAAELTEKNITDQRIVSKFLILAKVKKATIHESAWIEGSIVRCGKHITKNLKHARWYKNFVYARKQAGTYNPVRQEI